MKKTNKNSPGETKKNKNAVAPAHFYLKKPLVTAADSKRFYEFLEQHDKTQPFFTMANLPNYLFWDKFQFERRLRKCCYKKENQKMSLKK